MNINENTAPMATQLYASAEKLDWATRHHGRQDTQPKLVASSSRSLSEQQCYRRTANKLPAKKYYLVTECINTIIMTIGSDIVQCQKLKCLGK